MSTEAIRIKEILLGVLYGVACWLCLCIGSSESLAQPPASHAEVLVDAVIASVDGTPITLQELGASLVPPRKLALEEAARDPQLRAALDALIMQRLIEAEAQSRKIKVDDSDIERYVEEVAARNQMSRADFEAALIAQGGTMAGYRQQVRGEIMRSRILAQVVQGSVTVSDEEIDEVVGTGGGEDSDEQEEEGQRLLLREIVIAKDGKSEEEVAEKVERIESALSEDSDFENLARMYSESPTAADGGSLGTVNSQDLADSVRDEVESLDEGEFSDAIEEESSIRFFKLEKRYEKGQVSDQRLRDEVRNKMESRRFEEKAQEFFMVQLPKQHYIDRKF